MTAAGSPSAAETTPYETEDGAGGWASDPASVYQPLPRRKRKLLSPPKGRPAVLVGIAAVLAMLVPASMWAGEMLGTDDGSAGLQAAAQSAAAAKPVIKLSKSRFTKKMDRHCVAAARSIKSLDTPRSTPQMVRYLRDSLAIAKRYLRRLGSDPAPAAQRGVFARYMTLNRKAVRSLDDLIAQVKAGDVADMATRLTEIEALGRQGAELESRYGMRRCARISVAGTT